MPIRRSSAEVGLLRGRRIVASLCQELDDARVAAGLSYADLGAALGMSGQQASRICRGRSPDVSFVRMAGLLGAVGLELSSRAYPAGPPVRDAAHLALLERFRDRLPDSIPLRSEVPVIDGAGDLRASSLDRRAWDALIEGPRWRVGVEAETRLGDVQALERRVALKQRDGGIALVVLLVNDTAHNRRILADPAARLRTHFPGPARDALRRLASGLPPASSTIVVL